MSESKWREMVAEVLAEHRLMARGAVARMGCRGCDFKGTLRPDANAAWEEFADHQADALSPVLAQMKREWQAEAWEMVAHEIRHSVMPNHPNAGYRDGHEHAAWVAESLGHAYRAEASGQEGER